MKQIILSILFCHLLGLTTWAQIVYTPENLPKVHLQDKTRYVCDPENILDITARDSIDHMLYTLEQQTGIQTVVAVVPSIGDADCFDFCHQLLNSWGVGQKGKDNVDSKFAKVRSTKSEITTITTLFEIFDKLTEVKLLIINKLNALSQYGKFVVKSNGDMEAVGDEGFVITTTDAKGAKLVDRYSFSKNNFSKDIIKSWTHKS